MKKNLKGILYLTVGLLVGSLVFAHVVYETRMRPGVAQCWSFTGPGPVKFKVRGKPSRKGAYIKVWDDDAKATLYTNLPCAVQY